MRKVVVEEVDEMEQAPPSPTRDFARDELALLVDAARQSLPRRSDAGAARDDASMEEDESW